MAQDIKTLNEAPGVKDLPVQVRSPFISAIRAEQDGDKEKAEAKLAEAIAKEGELKK